MRAFISKKWSNGKGRGKACAAIKVRLGPMKFMVCVGVKNRLVFIDTNNQCHQEASKTADHREGFLLQLCYKEPGIQTGEYGVT